MMMWERTFEGSWVATRLPERKALVLAAGVSVVSWGDPRRSGLFVRGDVLVNGVPTLPFHVLEHRDEIRVASKLFCFSVASPPEKARFEPSERDMHCARCAAVLSGQERVLLCPLCRAPHHTECFDYAPTCGACTEEMAWMPDDTGETSAWRH